MEFMLTTDLSALPKQLECNFEEVKDWLSSALEKYENLVVTEDDLSRAKADVAKLRKFTKALDSERIAIKKAYMAPYTALEERVSELKAMCERPIQAIDGQVKAFEERRKHEKKDALHAYFDAKCGAAAEYIAFEDVLDPKWLNVTFDMAKAKEQIDEILQRFNEDTKALEEICKGCTSSEAYALRECFWHTHSISRVLEYKNQMNAHREDHEAHLQEPVFCARELTDRIMDDSTICANGDADNMRKDEVEITFRVRGTAEQIQKLKAFLISTGIEYSKA